MADKKISELVTLNTASGDDLLLVVNDPSGTPASRKITVNNLFGNVVVSTTHKAATTFQANTFIHGTVCTVSANVNVTAGLTVNSVAILPAIQDRMEVSNVVAYYARKVNTLISNTTISGYTSANTVTCQTLTIASNTGIGLTVTTKASPSSNNPATSGWVAGTIAYSNTYLYIAVDANTIKRVPLSVF